MPLPPSAAEGEEKSENETPALQFSYVECLLFTLHQLARRHTAFLSGDTEAGTARMKDFKMR